LPQYCPPTRAQKFVQVKAFWDDFDKAIKKSPSSGKGLNIFQNHRRNPAITQKHGKALVKTAFWAPKGLFPFETLLQMSKNHFKKLLLDRPSAVKWTPNVQKSFMLHYKTSGFVRTASVWR